MFCFVCLFFNTVVLFFHTVVLSVLFLSYTLGLLIFFRPLDIGTLLSIIDVDCVVSSPISDDDDDSVDSGATDTHKARAFALFSACIARTIRIYWPDR